jgi:hypothetical protein
MIDPLVIPIVAIMGLFFTIAVVSIAHYVYLIARMRVENTLKQDMLLRGFSAEEIVKVVSCGRGVSSSSSGELTQKSAKRAA